MKSFVSLFLQNLAMAVLGGLLALPSGRLAFGLCETGSALCRNPPSIWMWLLFGASAVLFLTGTLRVIALSMRFRTLWSGAAAEVAAEAAASDESQAAARRLATVASRPVEPSAPAPPPAIVQDPIAWLADQPAIVRDFIAQSWNWDHDLAILRWLVEQPASDGGVAAGIFWLSGAAEDYVPFGNEQPTDPDDLLVLEIERIIALRFAAGPVATRFAFDDSNAAACHTRVVAAFEAGAIDWNPACVPVESTGEPLTLDLLEPAAQVDARAFLRQHGVRF